MIPEQEDFLFVPLGGCGEIGMNLNLFGHASQWLMVHSLRVFFLLFLSTLSGRRMSFINLEKLDMNLALPFCKVLKKVNIIKLVQPDSIGKKINASLREINSLSAKGLR